MITQPAVTSLLAYVPAAGVLFLWTGFILVSRAGVVSGLTPWDVIGLRYTVAGLVLAALWLSIGRPRIVTPRHIVLAVIGGLGYSLLAFPGFSLAPASHAGVLLPGSMPFLAAAWAWFIEHQRPRLSTWAGYAAIAVGVGSTAVTSGMRDASHLRGDICFLGAAALWTLYAHLLRRWECRPLPTTIAVTVLTSAAYVPFWLVMLPSNVSDTSWQVIAVQAGYQGILAATVQMLRERQFMPTRGPDFGLV